MYGNELERLPESLPEGLKKLDVGRNESLQRPNRLPPNLESLGMANCRLTELPTLPNSLEKLEVDNNQLHTLPDTLPALLSSLLVSSNRLTALPENLPGSLRDIYAKDNQLSQLPDLAHLPQNCSIRLDGNPFSTSTLQALQHLYINLDYQGPRISCRELDNLPPVSLRNIVATWVPPEQQKSLAEDWAKIEKETNSGDFNVFLCRLATTQNVKNIPEFKQQIAAWLLQLAGSFTLREQTFLIAQEASATCEDRITLTHNDMQKAVMLH
ncbi:leucine Rich Repeat family protein, partial [Yersinia pestis PY-88]